MAKIWLVMFIKEPFISRKFDAPPLMLQFANNETGPTFLFQEMKALSLKMAVRFSLLLINPFLKKPKS